MKVKDKVVDNVENVYTVPVKQWSKWSSRQHAYFNKLYKQLSENQCILSTCEMPEKDWLILSWNIAWIATDDVSNECQH